MSNLPPKWSWVKLGNLIGKNGIFVDGDWVESKDQDPNGEVRLIQLADIGEIEFRNKSDRYLTYKKALELNCTFLEKGDLLIARMPDPLGRACIFPLKGKEKFVTVVDVAIIRVDEKKVNNNFLCYVINAPQSRNNISSLQSGSTRKRISRKNLGTINFPLPPLPEQKKIVEKIEELFSGLDSGSASLKKAKEQIRFYRTCLLDHAIKGKLSENSKKNYRSLAISLLKKIELERAKEYQEQIATAKKLGKKKPPILNTTYTDTNINTFNIPENWSWCRIKDIYTVLTDYHANGSYEFLKKNVELLDIEDYALMVRSTNFEKNDFHYDVKFITKKAYEALHKSKLFGSEILIGKIGNAGKVYFMPKLNRPASLAMNLFAIRFHPSINPKYIYLHLCSNFSAMDIKKHVRGVGNVTIDKKGLRSINIALPPTEEQDQIVEEIEKRFSEADNLEKAIDESLEKSDWLRQSILKKAFEGKLV